jgi:predicted transposase/invertase (TIGR01784 family)
LEYSDVRSAVEYARDEGINIGVEKGINIGREEGIEKGKDIGREEGMEKGIDIGVEQGKILIARKCLEKNMSIDDISDLTGLSKKQILQLK